MATNEGGYGYGSRTGHRMVDPAPGPRPAPPPEPLHPDAAIRLAIDTVRKTGATVEIAGVRISPARQTGENEEER